MTVTRCTATPSKEAYSGRDDLLNMEEVCNDFSFNLYSSIILNLDHNCCKAFVKFISGITKKFY
jgi:hypothetical protein